MSAAPPARRRLVGAALRRYRESTGYDLADAARVLACDRSKISRIESGERGIRAEELRALLVDYEVDAQAEQALLALSAPGLTRGWWQEPGAAVADGMAQFAPIEALASAIGVFEAHRVPDLLQTEDYARVLIAAGPADDEAAAGAGQAVRESRLAAVLARQRAVLGRHPDITVVIAEAALLNVVGGARVTRGQLDWLARTASDSGHAEIRLLPLTRGAQVAATGSMTIAEVGGVPCLGAVHVPGVRGGICLDEPSDVAAYTRAFEQIKLHALSPAASARSLRDMAARRVLRGY
ncbi:MAG TPA: helix-turn-helix transcriptional regulator [Trebonia sp.]|nr:helix-turn-helix transcriptional regulator [Trebonia sp.]